MSAPSSSVIFDVSKLDQLVISVVGLITAGLLFFSKKSQIRSSKLFVPTAGVSFVLQVACIAVLGLVSMGKLDQSPVDIPTLSMILSILALISVVATFFDLKGRVGTKASWIVLLFTLPLLGLIAQSVTMKFYPQDSGKFGVPVGEENLFGTISMCLFVTQAFQVLLV